MSFYRTFTHHKDAGVIANINETTKIYKTSLKSNCMFLHKDLADSLNVASTFFHSWIKINVLLGLLNFFKARYIVKTSQLHRKDKSSNDDKEEPQKPSHGFNLLRKSCVAREICLSNQETTLLKNPTANMVAETLR